MMGGKRSSVWEGVSRGEVEQGHTEGYEFRAQSDRYQTVAHFHVYKLWEATKKRKGKSKRELHNWGIPYEKHL